MTPLLAQVPGPTPPSKQPARLERLGRTQAGVMGRVLGLGSRQIYVSGFLWLHR